jgi:hypothetical protein
MTKRPSVHVHNLPVEKLQEVAMTRLEKLFNQQKSESSYVSEGIYEVVLFAAGEFEVRKTNSSLSIF